MRSIFLLLFLVVQSCISIGQTFEGNWKGELMIQGQVLPLLFEIQKDKTNWSAFMISPAQSNTKFPVTTISVREDSIFIDVRNIGLSYHGVKKGDIIEGKFKQGAFETTMNLSKYGNLEKPISALVRSQVVSPPYSYDTLAVRIRNDFDNITLAGTLTFPKKKGQYPAVLLLTGSGPQNRDEELFGHKPFRILADYLTRNGIVVLRVDDRGVAESTGNFENSTIENFSKDAISAFNYLKKMPQVDKRRVGIIGHSEGALIAELLAGQHLPDLGFIGLLAGPSFSIDKMMVEQLYAVGKAAGISESELSKARVINTRNFEIVKSELPTAEAYQQLVDNMLKTGIRADNKQMERELLTMLAPAYRYFMRIEPEKYIENITIPVFAAFGTLDVQVPSDLNVKSLHNHLPKNTQTVLKEYDGMNHLFQKAETGQLSEYAKIEETINPQVMKDLATWIKGLK